MVPIRTILTGILLPLFAAGCTETQFVIQSAKEISGVGGADVAKTRGDYKVGRPYQIAGTWYYPAEDFEYRETGIASWYGPNFHGKRTANGETFDQNSLTAAHRTLPMPSLVRVVNLQNGRSLMLRVNDRGPFARGRIIDVSRRAAQLLGFRRQGTARVRVEIMAPESRQMKLAALNSEAPAAGIAAAPAAPNTVETAPLETPLPPQYASATPPEQNDAGPVVKEAAVDKLPVSETQIFVQAGAYVDYANASRVRSLLSRHGPAWVKEAHVGRQKFYRVRVGPLFDVDAADTVLSQVISSGFPKAQIVVD